VAAFYRSALTALVVLLSLLWVMSSDPILRADIVDGVRWLLGMVP
jgi:hypothetical protein